MKPAFSLNRRRGERRSTCRFPFIDHNYQTNSYFELHGGHCANVPGPSFRNISRDYFRNEARWNFLAEVLFFAVIIAIAAVPLINGALAIMHFLHLPAA